MSRVFWRRGLAWALPVLTVLGGVAFLVQGADSPADPYFRAPAADGTATSVPVRTRVPGFGEITFRVDSTANLFGGASLQAARCALLAETHRQIAQGLMHRRDLAGYDGMLFVFDREVDSGFWMKDTLLSLSIAWFDADGRFVSSADMEPCGDQRVCPTYNATGPYRYALEVLQGDLAELGIGPGSRLVLGERSC